MSAILNNTKINAATSLGIRSRLIIGFSVIALIFMVAMGATLWIVHSTKVQTQRVLNVELPSYDLLLEFQTSLLHFERAYNYYLTNKSPTSKADMVSYMNDLTTAKTSLDQYSSDWPQEYATTWREIAPSVIALTKVSNQVSDSPEQQTLAANTEVSQLVNQIMDKIQGKKSANSTTEGMVDRFHKHVSDDTRVINNSMKTVEILLLVTTLLGIAAVVIATMLTTRSIAKHINVYRAFSSRIAAGDLTHSLPVSSRDEIGQLGEDLNVMNESLSNITKQITGACQSMVTSLEEVKQTVNTQTSGATEQASSINEITASLEEIEQSSAQTMEKAKALGEVAERTRETGQLGLNAVEQSIQGMKSVRDKVQMIAQTILDLSNQTQQVGEITSVVSSLAQQSKMLALNASIEAAKAGEAGKGFAVVASEVKNLAEQSEQSTAQVQKILEDIRHATEKAVMVTEEGTKGVDTGTDLVEETGNIVKSLSEVIQEATIASQQIEAAVRQESVGIEQITAAMGEINQVTSSFVNSAKETTEAINNLATIAKNLKERVDTYKV